MSRDSFILIPWSRLWKLWRPRWRPWRRPLGSWRPRCYSLRTKFRTGEVLLSQVPQRFQWERPCVQVYSIHNSHQLLLTEHFQRPLTYSEVEHCRPSIDLLSNLTEISARPSIDLSDFLRRCAHDSKTTSEAVGSSNRTCRAVLVVGGRGTMGWETFQINLSTKDRDHLIALWAGKPSDKVRKDRPRDLLLPPPRELYLYFYIYFIFIFISRP